MIDTSIGQLLERGLESQRAGKLAEAEVDYRRALAAAPNHPDALHLLGLVAHQAGRHAEALDLIDRASAAEPMRAAYHKHAGLALLALGRADASAARLRRAARLRPEDAEAHNHLGSALQQLGRPDEAFASYQEALRLAPGYAAAALNLGNVLVEEGRCDEALGCYVRARSLESTPQFQLAFALALQGAGFDDASGIVSEPAVFELALRALAEPWARPADLARGCVRLLLTRPAIRRAVARANDAWPRRLDLGALLGDDGMAALAQEPLLVALMRCTPVADAGLERMLTSVRRALLDDAYAEATAGSEMDAPGHAWTGAEESVDSATEFHCALARQCFLNDYVFDAVDDELARSSELGKAIASRLESGEGAPSIWIAIVGAYLPLGSIGAADRLSRGAWPEAVETLVRAQVVEPRRERELAESIPRLTPIDRASSAVRAQYEEHPYPKWTRLPRLPSSEASAAPADAEAKLSDARTSGVTAPPSDILVAGCGTGQESIDVALGYPSAQVLAVDLSLASLAYAERKAREIGIGNLTHAQADILRLAELGRSFDVIYSVGVLHHLAEPAAGLRILASMLRSGGSMLIGLYSERARRDIVAAREHIAASGYRAVADDIRRCRQELMASGSDTPFGRVARLRDFHTTSECRDLLFHVEEHRYTLPQVQALLDSAGLRAVALAVSPEVRRSYLRRFPEDQALADLAHWDAFEAEYPDAFAGMYLLWVGRASVAD